MMRFFRNNSQDDWQPPSPTDMLVMGGLALVALGLFKAVELAIDLYLYLTTY